MSVSASSWTNASRLSAGLLVRRDLPEVTVRVREVAAITPQRSPRRPGDGAASAHRSGNEPVDSLSLAIVDDGGRHEAAKAIRTTTDATYVACHVTVHGEKTLGAHDRRRAGTLTPPRPSPSTSLQRSIRRGQRPLVLARVRHPRSRGQGPRDIALGFVRRLRRLRGRCSDVCLVAGVLGQPGHRRR